MPKIKSQDTVECWGKFELRLSGPSEGNPFTDVEWVTMFYHKDLEIKVKGFYAGEGEYAVRFMPGETGDWRFETFSECAELNRVQGTFTCTAPSGFNHGPVRARDSDSFAYADGTSFYPFGTTAYAWVHQSGAMRSSTLHTLAEGPFNKIRMCIFPKHYPFNAQESEHYPFAGTAQEGFQTNCFNTLFWDHLDECIVSLLELGIEADVILFHPYDKGRWGFDRMSAEADDRYLRYVIARLGAYRNVWWAIANEYDFMKAKTMPDWDRLIGIASTEDHHKHLLSIHNGTEMYNPESIIMYDHTRPEITHCSIQHWDVTLVTSWRRLYKKPVIVDECGYEGDLPFRWGNLSAEEMTHRVWEGFVRGGFVTHGESFLHLEDEIWWAKGGRLYGRSTEQIRFLRSIAEEAPHGIRTIPVRDVPVLGLEGTYYLHYYGQHQPAYREVELPEDAEFTAEWIDTQGIKITKIESTFRGKSRIPLPGKPYYALRIRAVELTRTPYANI